MDQIKSYHKNPDVVSTELENGAILLNLNTKYYYNLNETGLSIWRALDETGYSEEIVPMLMKEYDTDKNLASYCTNKLLDNLEKEGLIFKNK